MEPVAETEPFISVRQLRHAYDNRTAFNGVSFAVYPTEIFGLLGPNGSGKDHDVPSSSRR